MPCRVPSSLHLAASIDTAPNNAAGTPLIYPTRLMVVKPKLGLRPVGPSTHCDSLLLCGRCTQLHKASPHLLHCSVPHLPQVLHHWVDVTFQVLGQQVRVQVDDPPITHEMGGSNGIIGSNNQLLIQSGLA